MMAELMMALNAFVSREPVLAGLARGVDPRSAGKPTWCEIGQAQSRRPAGSADAGMM